jgi:hypothetical protein
LNGADSSDDLSRQNVGAPKNLMKRHGQLMAKIADAENLRLAFWKAAKGKRGMQVSVLTV